MDEHPYVISYYRVSSFDFNSKKVANSITVSVQCNSCVKRRYYAKNGVLCLDGEPEFISIFDIAGRTVFTGQYYKGMPLDNGMYMIWGAEGIQKVVGVMLILLGGLFIAGLI